MSGTDLASRQIENHFSSFVFLKPRLPGVPKMNQIIIKLIPKVAAYARATWCPVLTCTALATRVLRGVLTYCVVLSTYARATRCPVLT
eukprot:1076155-Rhodomonas_salina.3